MRRLPLALVLLLVAPAVAAQVYKWTDAHGTVHYSETPPPQGTPFKRISTAGIATDPAPAPEPGAEPGSEPTGETTPQPQAPVADTPENRAKLCSSLSANLDALKGKGPVVMEQQGKPVALDEQQRQQQTAAAQKQYEQFCAR